MREGRLISVTKKNRNLPIIRDILTKKIGEMSLREGTSRRDEEMEVPSTKKVDWYQNKTKKISLRLSNQKGLCQGLTRLEP
jgi:hypothetical protein